MDTAELLQAIKALMAPGGTYTPGGGVRIAPQAPTPTFTPQQEAEFQGGVRETPWWGEFVKRYGEEPDLDQSDYNYRAAWAGGVRPEWYPPDNSYHWASEGPEGSYKAVNHPSAWMNDYLQLTGRDPHDPGQLTRAQIEIMKRALRHRYRF